jgi:hypothetical protein
MAGINNRQQPSYNDRPCAIQTSFVWKKGAGYHWIKRIDSEDTGRRRVPTVQHPGVQVMTVAALITFATSASIIGQGRPAITGCAADLIFYGATPGGSCDAAFRTFVTSTARELVVSKGSFILTNNSNLPAGYKIHFENGGMLSLASGVVFTINGEIEAGNHQIFSGAGTFIFTTSSPNGFVNVRWPGALDSNARTDDSTVPFNKAIASVPNSAASRGMYVYVPSGHYNFASGIRVPSSLDIRGDSQETTILRAIFSESGTLIAVPGNVQARFRDIQIQNDSTIVSTNSGISIGNSGANLSKLELQNVTIRHFTANALAMTNVAYLKATKCVFIDNQNSAALNGTTTTIARAVFLSGAGVPGLGNDYANAIVFEQCRFEGNDQAVYWPFGSGLVLNGCTIENNGVRIGLNAPSTLDIGSTLFAGFYVYGGYMEGNFSGVNEGVIKLGNGRGANIQTVIFNSRGGIQRSYNSIFVAGQSKSVVVGGSAFDGALQCFITNRASAPVIAIGNSYALATIGTNAVKYLTNYAQLATKMSVNVVFDTEVDGIIAPVQTLAPTTFDPAGIKNGALWYRGDLDRVRIRLGGTNYNVSVE